MGRLPLLLVEKEPVSRYVFRFEEMMVFKIIKGDVFILVVFVQLAQTHKLEKEGCDNAH